MNFENSNALYELAAQDAGLAAELEKLHRSYSNQMHEYILSMARQYGVSLEADCFQCGSNFEQNSYKQHRLRIVGLILNKKPEERQKLLSFSRQLDEAYAAEKIALSGKYGIELSREEAGALCLWTGIL